MGKIDKRKLEIQARKIIEKKAKKVLTAEEWALVKFNPYPPSEVFEGPEEIIEKLHSLIKD